MIYPYQLHSTDPAVLLPSRTTWRFILEIDGQPYGVFAHTYEEAMEKVAMVHNGRHLLGVQS